MNSLIIGYVLDLIIGDPQGWFHPIRLIGNMICFVEDKLRKCCKNSKEETAAGAILWFSVVFTSFVIPYVILYFASKVSFMLALIIEGLMCYYILATKSLKDESMKVYKSLKRNDLAEARNYLSFIVGRDVEKLNEVSVAKAAVETVAENASDGVIAPMLYIMIGGAPLGFMYKAVNTLDSMVGYKNEKYINIGRVSAIADDVANFIPSRISALIMIAVAFITGMDYKNALRIYLRDRYNHKSPNSAHTESVCAGALDIMLGGDSYYGGALVSKPTIGDDIRKIEIEDIKRANRLMYAASMLTLATGSLLYYFVTSL
ncbi:MULTISPECIES: adenosylcobinamide-phosphate synthase CbiB [unclassified Sedimentibacter]|uniref:adenosylcobinamide-phosphate synthase CbiB n=1 Tax=unclassified Sedimentibacter TaxID=2649220 RepID=UPI0027DF40F7|nr:adenosylcobinamide-phosphate synthase CbiB [Sedimentibacter sp. MB35-C1]WMJ75771.1 adenosylcobinamide-phosphate synthase CbiB [Sedimentibacter sp. MB35-C1]